MNEPTTRAGRWLLAQGNRSYQHGWIENNYEDTQRWILAIEAEARASALREAAERIRSKVAFSVVYADEVLAILRSD